jgi:NTE family protein
MSSSYKYSIPKVQRALVLQGGGALGAYQAGVFKSVYEKMKRNQNNDGNDDHHLFDIIAGTSVGAINGAILVSYFLENKKMGRFCRKTCHFGSICQPPHHKYQKH